MIYYYYYCYYNPKLLFFSPPTPPLKALIFKEIKTIVLPSRFPEGGYQWSSIPFKIPQGFVIQAWGFGALGFKIVA